MTQLDLNRLYCTSFDEPWCGKQNEPILMSVYLLNQKLQALFDTFGDLGWTQMTFTGVTGQNLHVGHHK